MCRRIIENPGRKARVFRCRNVRRSVFKRSGDRFASRKRVKSTIWSLVWIQSKRAPGRLPAGLVDRFGAGYDTTAQECRLVVPKRWASRVLGALNADAS